MAIKSPSQLPFQIPFRPALPQQPEKCGLSLHQITIHCFMSAQGLLRTKSLFSPQSFHHCWCPSIGSVAVVVTGNNVLILEIGSAKKIPNVIHLDSPLPTTEGVI